MSGKAGKTQGMRTSTGYGLFRKAGGLVTFLGSAGWASLMAARNSPGQTPGWLERFLQLQFSPGLSRASVMKQASLPVLHVQLPHSDGGLGFCLVYSALGTAKAGDGVHKHSQGTWRWH